MSNQRALVVSEVAAGDTGLGAGWKATSLPPNFTTDAARWRGGMGLQIVLPPSGRFALARSAGPFGDPGAGGAAALQLWVKTADADSLALSLEANISSDDGGPPLRVAARFPLAALLNDTPSAALPRSQLAADASASLPPSNNADGAGWHRVVLPLASLSTWPLDALAVTETTGAAAARLQVAGITLLCVQGSCCFLCCSAGREAGSDAIDSERESGRVE